MVVAGPDGLVAERGETDQVLRLASVTKPLVAYACLIACQEGVLDLDAPAGPPGATIRHLLAHASGLGFDDMVPLSPVGKRRIYSNPGFERLGDVLAAATGMPVRDYLREGIFEPLGMTATELRGSPAHGARGTAADVARFGRELLRPTLVEPELLAEATGVQFPGLAGVLPGIGRQRPDGLGPRLRPAQHQGAVVDGRVGRPANVWALRRHRHVPLGRPRARAGPWSPWLEREFDEWALAAWIPFNDALPGRAASRQRP